MEQMLMNVKLISYSMVSKELFDADNSLRDVQGLIAYCARVSNPSNQINSETSEKLIKYLIKHQHWSPLEMVNACLEIQTTRDIAHQIVRHRSFSFQEFSQRYANPEEQGEMFEYSEARLQDTKNRQNSIDVDDEKLQLDWLHAQMRIAYLVKKNTTGQLKTALRKSKQGKYYQKVLQKQNFI
jgi:thymidylate synthase (FAD)